jgi:hypothetical protein
VNTIQCALIATSALVWFYAALALARSIHTGGIVMSKSRMEDEWEEAVGNKWVWLLLIIAMFVCAIAVLYVWTNGGM